MRDTRLSSVGDPAIVPAMTVPSPRTAPWRALRAAAAAAALLLAAASCGREGRIVRVEFPTTPVLTVRSTWAVVTSPLLRVREQPDSRSTVLQHIRQGVVVEVIGKSDREDEIEDQQDFWYRINYEGLKGWVFGPYLTLSDSRAAAEAEAARLR
jgi:uncharacterized protein YgiM (DUF1202 family)